MATPLSTATTFIALENRMDTVESKVADGDKGDVIISGSTITLDAGAITSKASGTPEDVDFIVFSDTSAGGALKRGLIGDLPGGGGGGGGTELLGQQIEDATDLNALIVTANSNPGTKYAGVVTDSIVLSSGYTVPANILGFWFAPEGRFTDGGGGTLTFANIGILGDPRHQIFSGFSAADLTWLSARPQMRPEWFGAVADGSTDCSAAINVALDVVNNQNAAGRHGGTVIFQDAVYACASQIGGQIYRNVRLQAAGMKPMSFGAPGPCILKYTGTGSTTAFNFSRSQAMQLQGIAFLYSSTSFTGVLVDMGVQSGTFPKEGQALDCYFGGYWTQAANSNVPMLAKDLLRLAGQIESTVRRCAFIGGVNGVRLQPGEHGGGADTNIITIAECAFNLLTGAGILNPYQGCIIVANNFETINFGLSFGNQPTPHGSMVDGCIADDYVYSGTNTWSGVTIQGNWFGDRAGNGGAYIRAGYISGGVISGNFFGGGFNGYGIYSSAASGTSGDDEINVSGASFAADIVGTRVWIHEENYTGVVTARMDADAIVVTPNLGSTFSGKTIMYAAFLERNYIGNVSGSSGGTLVTVTGVTLPTNLWGLPVWINGTYVGKVADRSYGTNSFNVDTPLPSIYSGADMRIGIARYNTAAISALQVSGTVIEGNAAAENIHTVNIRQDVVFEINDLSVTNGSSTVTVTTPYAPCDLVGYTIEAAPGIPAEGWSVPPGTTITAVDGATCGFGSTGADQARDNYTFTLSNNVTVTSGQNPRRAVVKNPNDGGGHVIIVGGSVPDGWSNGFAVTNPYTNERAKSVYNYKNGCHITMLGVSTLHPTGAHHNWTNANSGFASTDFGSGKGGVIAVGSPLVVPTANPASGILLYGQSNGLWMRTAAGTVAQMLPVLTATAALNFDLSSAEYQDLPVTVTGAAVGDVVSLGIPHGAVEAGMSFTGWVSAADTVTVRAVRGAGTTPNPASGTFRVNVTKAS